ncbi:hypothetical protein [Oceanobacillus senegalensis]|uniref:hypothetical protein n=1 Tax=Oceanobacillus senegalensis TaxID=1936063 RepID=UPI000A306151|nr:hypothetical protein [Oceanobacillus senegalensis]
MILPIVGNVSYSITLDPTVWIFDDRKILLEEAFTTGQETKKENKLEKAAERFNNEVVGQYSKPPVNRSISKMEGKEFLKNSYVMPIKDFIRNAEIKSTAKHAILKVENDKSNIQISLEELENGYLQFSRDGKPLKDDGPVYFYYNDGSNKDNPIKNIKKIEIN